ncbi:glycosyltransferase family 2 protein [Agromyces silvae]|uniref:glycosyltransferase family 2 protein n=1 Tax=Agromyces silvae TaxID=3388266 RepID=UPI00280B7689|nr:glycosyltransferase [Agromyces protaetiae]
MMVGVPPAHRMEIWVDLAGTPPERTATIVSALRTAGFEADRIRFVSDANQVGVESPGAEFGIETLTDVAALTERLMQTEAEFVCVVRRAAVVPGLAPVTVGFLDRFPQVALAYGDSSTAGGAPLLRPRFSPIRLRGNDYLGPVVVARAAALRTLSPFRADARGASIYDLFLRAADHGLEIELIPDALAIEDLVEDLDGEVAFEMSAAQARVVREHLAAEHIEAEVEEIEPFVRRVRYAVDGEPLVSIVIPTRGGVAEIAGYDRVLVTEAVRGIVDRTTYRNLEFVVVADRDTPESVIADLEALCGDRLRLVAWDAPFNFSAKMNRGAVAARGEYLLLLNDDVEVVTDDWIDTMLGLAQQPGVGIVGAQLHFEDSTIQHAGQIYLQGVAGHAGFGWRGRQDDGIASTKVDHEVSGVTAAAAMIARDLFLELGGFTLELPGNYNDVDLNMKVRERGLSAVVSPWARLYHFESKTRDPKILGSDIATLQSRWSRRMQTELYSRMM